MTISGRIVDVVSSRVFGGELTISEGRVTSIKELDTSSSDYIIPGFIDAHVHVESSMLIPSEFARLAVVHGTVGSVSDPHEIANVLGIEGVRFMIENGLETPFKFYFGGPSCVPATLFETAGSKINLEELEEIFTWENITYLAEMMNYPGVLNEDPNVMKKIKLAISKGKVVDGHAPGLTGVAAEKYINAGISTDHECYSVEEAVGKLKGGMKILIREGSAAKNFEALYTLIDDYPDMIMFCSDDKHPNELVRSHINQVASRAIAKGCDLFNVLRACSLTPVGHYKMDVGLLQVGDPADFCVVKDLKSFEVKMTYIDGQMVALNRKSLIDRVKVRAVNHFDCSLISSNSLKVADLGKNVKVLVVEDGQLITKKEVAQLNVSQGFLQIDIERDILKIVVVNRYIYAAPALAFVKNFGLREGAIASSVAHDSHNIIAVGTNDEDISSAINLIIKAKGGISLACGSTQEILPLPIAGIMSREDGYKVAQEYELLDFEAKKLGSHLSAPFMTLSFCALLVIPELKISDRGLFDGNTFSLTSLYVD